MNDASQSGRDPDHGNVDRPPFLTTWRNVYLLMVVVLTIEIGIMYWLTHHFA
ncbi:MAG: hypothetical protein JST41_13400 [Bacteroidetes bacterium]|mgnify:FL=1|jgi:hypothetical protein|nr:hypothetical protein [Bacteroidota bacterium]MCC6654067.1 hypothetical protein [Flavobacteriales bacterium]HMU14930.1 hypothetical protein [Flavobacteriales bacterium]HMW96182.1 hypothetical protein [Flavobacteriales bacterium]HRT53736.1 hypothetical protein [Flavobacteriales bacterium]